MLRSAVAAAEPSSTATTPTRPRIPRPRLWPTARRRMPASTTTRSRFPGPVPPGERFWSVTCMTVRPQLLVEESHQPLSAQLPDAVSMKKNPDGSLTLYIQNKIPGADKETNWLPAPDDTIYLVMRLYWPKRSRRRSCRPAKALESAGHRRRELAVHPRLPLNLRNNTHEQAPQIDAQAAVFAITAVMALAAGCAQQADPVSRRTRRRSAAGVAGARHRGGQGDRRRGFHLRAPARHELRGDVRVHGGFPNSGQYKAPFNQINNEARIFACKDTSVPTPNSDTPYSILFMDLRAEPLVLSVPAVAKSRYYSVMLCDANTFNYGYMGSRATASEAGDSLVVGPDWKGETPRHQEGIPLLVAVLGGRVPHAAVQPCGHAERGQGPVRFPRSSRSAISSKPAPPASAAIDFPKIDKAMVKTNFFEQLDFILRYIPATAEETAIRAKLATIGVGAGKTFDFKDLSAEHKAAVLIGIKGRGR